MQIAKILITLTLLFGVAAAEAEAAKKKATSSTAGPSAAQRKKMFADGLINCRKRYGSQLAFVKVEKFYGRWAAVCYHY